MSSEYDNAIEYPYLQQFAEWAIMTNNNIVDVDVSGKKTLLFPDFPKGYYRVGILNGDFVVGNNSSNIYDYYTYLPQIKTWVNRFLNKNLTPQNKYLYIKYIPDKGYYEITNIKDELLITIPYNPPHQVVAPSSFPEEAPSGTESGDQSELKKTRHSRARSRSPSPEKKECEEGPGCVVMGGKKKTRRHKSRKQKKSKSKKHKKSKSKKSTRKK